MRGRSYSYSPSPPRGYSSRRYRSPSPRRGYHRGKELPTSLLVRNLPCACRPEDLRGPFGRFGPVKDIYLPRDYYTGLKRPGNKSLFKMSLVLMKNGRKEFDYIVKKTLKSSLTTSREPRGFGFVQFVDPADAADAKFEMDGYVLLGRELTVVFAEENRKKPSEMRQRDRVRSCSYDRRQSSVRYSRSPRYARTYSRSPDDYSPRGRHSRSVSPSDRSYRGRSYRGRSFSRSPYRSPYGSRSQSRSPYGSHSRSRSYSRSITPGYSR